MIAGQAGPAAATHRGRSYPVCLLPFGHYDNADALVAVAALRRLADLMEDAAAPEASGNLFRREGQYWTVCYQGLVARLTDAKGLRLLARLLADPGREFHAVDLEEAERCHDPGLAATASAERDFLVAELTRAVGLGGRDRRAASHAERARLNVTRAIRAAMANLTRANPALGAHLAATIRTGRYCSYTPDPRVPITWKL
jgi:hypothetical protein